MDGSSAGHLVSPGSLPSEGDTKENEMGSAETLPFLPLRIKQLQFIQLTLYFRGPRLLLSDNLHSGYH